MVHCATALWRCVFTELVLLRNGGAAGLARRASVVHEVPNLCVEVKTEYSHNDSTVPRMLSLRTAEDSEQV